jgi:hypothetical protein
VKTASPLTPIHTALGASTIHGTAERASVSEPSARSVIITATIAVLAIVTHTTPIQNGSVTPSRSRLTKYSSAPGGCPATWTYQLSGASIGMRSTNVCSILWIEPTRCAS